LRPKGNTTAAVKRPSPVFTGVEAPKVDDGYRLCNTGWVSKQAHGRLLFAESCRPKRNVVARYLNFVILCPGFVRWSAIVFSHTDFLEIHRPRPCGVPVHIPRPSTPLKLVPFPPNSQSANQSKSNPPFRHTKH